jgi:Phospholipase_D-nuclease N-terminal
VKTPALPVGFRNPGLDGPGRGIIRDRYLLVFLPFSRDNLSRTREPTTNEKILWFLVIFFLHLLGALIYYFVRRKNRR